MKETDKLINSDNATLSQDEVKRRVNKVDHVVIDDSVTDSEHSKRNYHSDDNYYPHPQYHTPPLKRSHYHDVAIERAGVNLSWRSILAGLLTFLALSVLFSLVFAAIGLGGTNLTSSNSIEGVGTGLIIWTIVSFILSLASGAFVAGLTANRAGALHGFLTWALGLVAALFLATSAVGSAFNTIGSLLGVAGDSISEVATSSGNMIGDLSQEAFDSIAGNLKIDTTNLDKEVQNVLEDSDIPELQPDYLQSQLDDTVVEIQEAAKAVVVDGKDLNTELEGVYKGIEERLTTIGERLDEDKLTKAIADNSDLTDAEAEKAVENIKTSYAEAQENAQQLLTEAQAKFNQLVKEAENTSEEVVEKTDEIMNETSKYSFITFVGLTLAAVIATYAGKKGAEAGSNLLDGATEVETKSV